MGYWNDLKNTYNYHSISHPFLIAGKDVEAIVAIDAAGAVDRDKILLACVCRIRFLQIIYKLNFEIHINWIRHKDSNYADAPHQLNYLANKITNYDWLDNYTGDQIGLPPTIKYAKLKNIPFIIKTCGDCFWKDSLLPTYYINPLIERNLNVEVVVSHDWSVSAGHDRFASTQLYIGTANNLEKTTPTRPHINEVEAHLIIEEAFCKLLKTHNSKIHWVPEGRNHYNHSHTWKHFNMWAKTPFEQTLYKNINSNVDLKSTWNEELSKHLNIGYELIA